MAKLSYWQEIGLDPIWVRREYGNGDLLESRETPPLTDEQDVPNHQQNGGFALPALAKQDKNVLLPSLIQESNDHAVVAQEADEWVENLGWEALEARIHACRACSLGCSRTNAVPGVGPRHVQWMVIGEAPGADEDRLGQPFVGQAGKLLDAMLNAIGLSRQETVYIANVLKCRPPNNRRPEPTEVAACLPFLRRQLALVNPKVLLAVGATAAQALLNTDAPIGRLRGTVHYYENRPLIVTYHPAYLLRSPAEKVKAWADLCLLRQTAQGLI